MLATDLLLVSHRLCLGTLELGLLDVQEILHMQLASMLTTLWHSICGQGDTGLHMHRLLCCVCCNSSVSHSQPAKTITAYS